MLDERQSTLTLNLRGCWLLLWSLLQTRLLTAQDKERITFVIISVVCVNYDFCSENVCCLYASSHLCSVCVSAEIGVALTGLGALLLFLGVLFFFDRGLLAMGNVRFLYFFFHAAPPGHLYVHTQHHPDLSSLDQ